MTTALIHADDDGKGCLIPIVGFGGMGVYYFVRWVGIDRVLTFLVVASVVAVILLTAKFLCNHLAVIGKTP